MNSDPANVGNFDQHEAQLRSACTRIQQIAQELHDETGLIVRCCSVSYRRFDTIGRPSRFVAHADLSAVTEVKLPTGGKITVEMEVSA